ncbi:MAG: glycine dehydrogenase (decarboxylating) [Candidatus Sericytochromatia bacterium]|nr:MAG: glycine dehydrogenase (decarboxylating) [Candidatus Sericytochromatia bacterium]
MLESFVNRHINISDEDLSLMLKEINVTSIDELIDKTIPEYIRLKENLNLPEPSSEYELLEEINKKANKNKVFKTYIGLGYYNTITPSVILRNIFENPSWYTSYTPYQAEISQGRLESLLNFQTAISELTGLPISNASLLDEGTAAAEAMAMFYRINPKKRFFISDKCFIQTIQVVKTRALALGLEVIIGDVNEYLNDENICGYILQYPDEKGNILDYSKVIEKIHQNKSLVALACDILSLTILKTPAEMNADVAFGSTQRLGIPLGYGGPHAAFFATKEEFKRQVPGRIIGVSIDKYGNKAYRMALQTREQHIRRDKANSNICTSQSLLANMASMYCIYHGPNGLKKISNRIHKYACILEKNLINLGYKQLNENFFDTLRIYSDIGIKKIKEIAIENKTNFRYINENEIAISIDETTSLQDIEEIVKIFALSKNIDFIFIQNVNYDRIDNSLKRKSEFLKHKIFNCYHSETELLRYIKTLEKRDISLTESMIPLGSCTMKLNPTTTLIPLSWRKFANIHPFVPKEQVQGYLEIIQELEKYLCEITGFSAVSLQPNSGAQGEFAGLLTIREYLKDNNQENRNIALIPSSAHGTNPASAVMAGFNVVVINCDENGNIDFNDLSKKVEDNKDNLAVLMITYPSTHGVFEENIIDICDLIHKNGGFVYMDGANMNAQVGLTNPRKIGADVCHLNLHKTFAIPHGGGGPGAGPIAVTEKLKKYLPSHPILDNFKETSITVSSAPWGSALILLISYSYIRLLGSEGLKLSTKYAILNANYIKSRLEKYYKVLFKGKNNTVAHEMIIDFREFKKINIDVEDIAKRLADYGFHAPTISWPVPGTIMIEPTESESKKELDKFCDAMISIYNEIKEIENEKYSKENNVLKNSPHTIYDLVKENWDFPYSKEKAVFPLEYLKNNKFFPSVNRINNAYGDRNLICTCPNIDDYKS